MKKRISEILLKISAFTVSIKEPFTFASGMLSPIYLDCRKIISFPEERRTIIDVAVDIAKNDIGLENIDVVAGGETAGIPFASWLSDRLNMPMIYVRKKPKDYGNQRQTEGVLKPGQRVLLFEDMISTGWSKLDFFEGIRNDQGVMEHCLVIFEYGYEDARNALDKRGIKLHSMSSLDSVLEIGEQIGYFKDEEIQEIKRWFKAPDKWGKKFKRARLRTYKQISGV